MFDMKNDDMDELFRKAAENYEVDTGKASNWDALSKALQNAETLPLTYEDKKKKKRRFFFWWFLLLPAAWIAHNAWEKIKSNPGDKSNAQAHLSQASGKKVVNAPIANKNSNDEQKAKVDNGVSVDNENNLVKSAEQTDNSSAQKNTAGGSVVVVNKENSIDDKQSVSTTNKKAGNHVTGTNNNSDNAAALIKHNLENKKYDKPTTWNKKNKIENNPVDVFVVEKQNRNDNIHELNKKEGAGISIPYGDYNRNITGSFQYVFRDYDGKVLPVISFSHTISKEAPGISRVKESVSTGSSLQKKKNKTDEPNPHYFYAAAVVAPDLSSVKFQRLSGTGSSIGLLLGYRLNKRLHTETGVMWEKKVYYTKGEYFDKSKLSDYYRNVEMLSVDGSCHMFTIPVNVRYNIHAGKKSNWFVATGMSSYLMNKEYYSYTYRHYGGGQPMTKGYGYKSSEKDWMSVINLNVGYERTFLRSFNLRVEPYFRLPVAGIGTGNLSITSGGIYIGIAKKF